MNNDLISREEAMDVIKSLQITLSGENIFRPEAKASVLECLDFVPQVDAEPVRHGQWIHCKGKSNLWYCSECGEKIIYNPTRKTYKPNKKPVHEENKRCRSCGAKMDRGVDNVDN